MEGTGEINIQKWQMTKVVIWQTEQKTALAARLQRNLEGRKKVTRLVPFLNRLEKPDQSGQVIDRVERGRVVPFPCFKENFDFKGPLWSLENPFPCFKENF